MWLVVVLALCVGTWAEDGWYHMWVDSPQELFTPVPLQVEGTIPSYVKGTFYRNGPGLFTTKKRNVTAWFDGFAKLHRYHFVNGTVDYMTRFIPSHIYNESMKIGDITPYPTWAPVDPPFTPEQRIEGLRSPGDNLMVNVWCVNPTKPVKSIIVTNDIPVALELDADTLNYKNMWWKPFGHSDPVAALPGFLSASHPHLLPGDPSHTVNFLQDTTNHTLWVFKVTDDMERKIIAKMTLPRDSYMHSFSVTSEHVIFFAYPGYFNVDLLQHGSKWLHWDITAMTEVFFLHVPTGRVSSVTTVPVFSNHHINAYIDPHTHAIVVDMICYPNSVVFQTPVQTDLNFQRSGAPVLMNSHICRFNVPQHKNGSEWVPTSADLVMHWQPGSACDFPRLHPHYVGLSYCHMYCTNLIWDFHPYFSLLKIDLCHPSGPKVEIEYKVDGYVVQESEFVPDPKGTADDDGVLVTTVNDLNTVKTYLMVIDAKTLKPVAKSTLPFWTGMPMHGQFIPDEVDEFYLRSKK